MSARTRLKYKKRDKVPTKKREGRFKGYQEGSAKNSRVCKQNSLKLQEILIMKHYGITLTRGNYETSGRQRNVPFLWCISFSKYWIPVRFESKLKHSATLKDKADYSGHSVFIKTLSPSFVLTMKHFSLNPPIGLFKADIFDSFFYYSLSLNLV